MPEIKFNDSSTTFHYYAWQEVGDITYKLSKKIRESGESFDRIVALATGGLTMAREMKDELGVKALSNIQVEFYEDIEKTKKTPIISQSLPVNIDGQRVLIFDDINDSGRTLKVAKKYLSLRGAKSVKTATLFQKPHTTLPSDFYVIDTECWVIFPDEKNESIVSLSKMWTTQGLVKIEIRKRLLEIGFTNEHIDDFCQNLC